MPGPEGNDALARAWALADAGDYGASLTEAERMIALEPDLAEAHTARGWALENLGPERLTDASDAYGEALRLDPEDLWAKEGLSNVLRRLGRPAEADALCVEVVQDARRRANDPELLEIRGWCEYRLGRLAEAEASFRRALDLDPAIVSVRLDLALVLLCQMRADEASSAYAAAIAGARGSGGMTGVVAAALDDLVEALGERDEVRRDPAAESARHLLRSFGSQSPAASSAAGTLPMGST